MSDEGIMLAYVSNALVHSPSFAELKRHSKLATFVIDENAADSILVGTGEDTETHFTRFRTLRINKQTGALERLAFGEDFEDAWLVEFQPKP